VRFGVARRERGAQVELVENLDKKLEKYKKGRNEKQGGRKYVLQKIIKKLFIKGERETICLDIQINKIKYINNINIYIYKTKGEGEKRCGKRG
jgi:hypothetical protein